MPSRSHPLVLGGRVNAPQMARVDAAARLDGVTRAQFTVAAALEKADEVLRRAVAEEQEIAA